MSEAGGQRCAVHPSRPAVDACPVCARPRCAADAGALGDGGCRACVAEPTAGRRPPSPLERLVRAVHGALATALVGGAVSAEYVGAPVFGLVTPVVVGAACGAAAQAAAGGSRTDATAQRVRAVAAVVAVLGVGLGLLVEGSGAPVSGAAVLPAVLAVAGAVLWTLPPRTTTRRGGRAG